VKFIGIALKVLHFPLARREIFDKMNAFLTKFLRIFVLVGF